MAVTQANIISGVTSIQLIKDSTYANTSNWDTAPHTAFNTDYGSGGTSSLLDVGAIQGPVVLEYSSEQEKIDIEQDTFVVKHILKAEGVTVKMNLPEATMYNMQIGMAGVAVPANNTTGPVVIGPISGTSATSAIHYWAIRIVAAGIPSNVVRRIVIAKAYATGNVGIPFTKSGIQFFPVEFSVARAQEDSGTGNLIPAVYIVDASS